MTESLPESAVTQRVQLVAAATHHPFTYVIVGKENEMRVLSVDDQGNDTGVIGSMPALSRFLLPALLLELVRVEKALARMEVLGRDQ
ncbi:hypothetical protein [Sphingomonas sp. 35-24ZXX]|uniref:hypothetical protein n=1 Tax=Sphingomonas sp. 35-24ZXX TaxID=1545915 RepID=UPI0012E08D68|nr:hypothetical protein [Sphingomonas sp. 35-24ZXX]